MSSVACRHAPQAVLYRDCRQFCVLVSEKSLYCHYHNNLIDDIICYYSPLECAQLPRSMAEFGCTRDGFNTERNLLPLVHGRIFLAISIYSRSSYLAQSDTACTELQGFQTGPIRGPELSYWTFIRIKITASPGRLHERELGLAKAESFSLRHILQSGIHEGILTSSNCPYTPQMISIPSAP